MKHLHEGRFGAPKTWKTGAVLSSYPKPLLLLDYDKGGYDIVRNIEHKVIKANDPYPSPLPPITVIDLSFTPTVDFNTNYVPVSDKNAFEDTSTALKKLRALPVDAFPFKTVVLDPVTELSEAIWRHQAVTNSSALADARKWAGNIGMKVQQLIDYINSLPCNTVCIFHTEVIKDEGLTDKVIERPMVYSKLRDHLGGKFTQFFYQEMIAGKPMIRVKGFALVQGIGARWPDFGARELIGPTFNDIYGNEKDVLR